jgi:hypothetical protein
MRRAGQVREESMDADVAMSSRETQRDQIIMVNGGVREANAGSLLD